MLHFEEQNADLGFVVVDLTVDALAVDAPRAEAWARPADGDAMAVGGDTTVIRALWLWPAGVSVPFERGRLATAERAAPTADDA